MIPRMPSLSAAHFVFQFARGGYWNTMYLVSGTRFKSLGSGLLRQGEKRSGRGFRD